jgi:hypothetical protein
MQQTVRVFHSFADSEKAEREYYASLSPEQRLDILLDLIARLHPHETEQRLERVYRVIKLGEG